MGNLNSNENKSGAYDPTAAKAIAHITKDERRFKKLLGTVFNMCELAGFHLEERLVVKDKRTGKIWR